MTPTTPPTNAVGRRAMLGAIALVCASWPFASRAAPRVKSKTGAPTRRFRLAALCSVGGVPPYFWRQLSALGYDESRNLEILFKDVDPVADAAAMAASLAAADVDAIVVCTNVDAVAAMRVTSRTPIVMLYGVAPVEAGLVASLARPGGNVTGSAAVSPELVAKSLEILKSAVPALRRVAVIVDLDDPVGKLLHAESERAARELGLSLTPWQVADDSGLERAFAAIARNRPDGVLVNFSVVQHLQRIVDFAARERLPAIYPVAPAVLKGGLLSYSPHWVPQLRRNAEIVDRIFRGAQPRDIPVEQPVDYVLGVNLKTARAMGLTIPPPLLLRATLVIE